MTLFVAAAIVTVGIGISCLVPHYSPWVRRQSRALLLIGTLVLLGFVLFDLVPEMVEIGGAKSLILIALSWAIFAGIHAFTSHSHETHHGSLHNEMEGRHHSVSFLLGSMALHCFAGGMLLVSSYAVSERLAFSVFLSLVAHKAFEAVSLSSLILERVRSRRHLHVCVSLYALSFPLGVLATVGFESLFPRDLTPEAVEGAAMVVTSVAVGSLFGCLLQDFLIPSLRELQKASWKFGRA